MEKSRLFAKDPRKQEFTMTLVIILLLATMIFTFGSASIVPVMGGDTSLTEEEVRRLIREHPGCFHFEAKPETIQFLSVKLVDKVWVVEYECEGRALGIALPPQYTPPPFTRTFVRREIDTYTGRTISFHAKGVEPVTAFGGSTTLVAVVIIVGITAFALTRRKEGSDVW